MCNINTESIYAAVGPETKSLYEVSFDLWVIPVEIGLFWGEEMAVPLPWLSIFLFDTRPC
jgi:hypothetical protein